MAEEIHPNLAEPRTLPHPASTGAAGYRRAVLWDTRSSICCFFISIQILSVVPQQTVQEFQHPSSSALSWGPFSAWSSPFLLDRSEVPGHSREVGGSLRTGMKWLLDMAREAGGMGDWGEWHLLPYWDFQLPPRTEEAQQCLSSVSISWWLCGYQPGHTDPFKLLFLSMTPAWVWVETVWVITAFYFQAPCYPMTPSPRLSMKRSTITWWRKSKVWLVSQVCMSCSCQGRIPVGGPDPNLIFCSSQIWESENS